MEKIKEEDPKGNFGISKKLMAPLGTKLKRNDSLGAYLKTGIVQRSFWSLRKMRTYLKTDNSLWVFFGVYPIITTNLLFYSSWSVIEKEEHGISNGTKLGF